tara:strand:- start:280 stop:594 length:315 start_codon:yes stop_codon:yes gene_type:complete
MKYYATRTLSGYHIIKANNIQKAYQITPKELKQEMKQTLVSKGMSKRNIRKEHLIAMIWNVLEEEIKTYQQERISKITKTKKELTNITDLLNNNTNNTISLYKL